jgi:hypothetical protein
MNKTGVCLGMTVLMVFCILAAAQSQQQSAMKVKVGGQLSAKAAAPAPGATAKGVGQKETIGTGKTSIIASQPSSFWSEELDVDDDGTVETSDFLYDAQRGIVYAYREDDFTCPNGKSESGSILTALYATGNKAAAPVGSGWYVVNVDEGQCAAQEAELYGCRFDASGDPTECGVATLDDATGELDLAVVAED